MLAGASCYHSADAGKGASGQNSRHACDGGYRLSHRGGRDALELKPFNLNTLEPARRAAREGENSLGLGVMPALED